MTGESSQPEPRKAKPLKAKDRLAAFLEQAHKLPGLPGVYLMKDADGVVFYVGKATNLKNRVSSYFQPGTSDHRAFVGLLGHVIADLETVVARSEKEALLLEREMIRRHAPRFNVMWRDDKQYLCLRVDTKHPYPWVQVVRNVKEDGARYFGPFHSASAARQTLRVVNRHFRLRTCRDSVLNNRKRPCLEYQIGRCPAPCVYDIDKPAYQESVQHVLMFLEGKGQQLAKKLEQRMWDASERESFEVAAHYRDQLRAVNKSLQQQKVAFAHLKDQDVFGLYREGEAGAVSVLEVRGGRVQNIVVEGFEESVESDVEILSSALLTRYALVDDDGLGPAPPPELVVPMDLDDATDLSDLLSEKRGRRVSIVRPQRGDRMALLDMAKDNAEHRFHEQRRKSGAMDETLKRLKDRLHLARLPNVMECFDISNLQGDDVVASKVCFVRGLPDKKQYRRYKVKTVKGQDDFASMYEVVLRRLQRGLKEGNLPDLIVIDGGKGQLNAARAAFKDAGVERVDLVALAKARTLDQDDEVGATKSRERVFRPNARDPVPLRPGSAEELLLARMRDEAHRFAITFQRARRAKKTTRSSLDEIEGVGPAKRRALLSHLGSLARIKAASASELESVPGIGPRLAAVIYAALHPGENVPNGGGCR